MCVCVCVCVCVCESVCRGGTSSSTKGVSGHSPTTFQHKPVRSVQTTNAHQDLHGVAGHRLPAVEPEVAHVLPESDLGARAGEGGDAVPGHGGQRDLKHQVVACRGVQGGEGGV